MFQGEPVLDNIHKKFSNRAVTQASTLRRCSQLTIETIHQKQSSRAVTLASTLEVPMNYHTCYWLSIELSLMNDNMSQLSKYVCKTKHRSSDHEFAIKIRW